MDVDPREIHARGDPTRQPLRDVVIIQVQICEECRPVVRNVGHRAAISGGPGFNSYLFERDAMLAVPPPDVNASEYTSTVVWG
jgi:hypothetical protein